MWSPFRHIQEEQQRNTASQILHEAQNSAASLTGESLLFCLVFFKCKVCSLLCLTLLSFFVSPGLLGQWDRAADHVVQPSVHSGAGYHHGAVGGDQHRQLEVQIHQSHWETVEGQRQPGLEYRPLPGCTVTCKVGSPKNIFFILYYKTYRGHCWISSIQRGCEIIIIYSDRNKSNQIITDP